MTSPKNRVTKSYLKALTPVPNSDPSLLLTESEVAEQRAMTPGTAHVTHFNYAGSALPTQAVLDAQLDYLRDEALHGGYEVAAKTQDAHDAVYASIASLIGAKSTEIARAEHATSAWNSAFWSLPMAPGQRILTVEAEYGANAVAFLRAKERYGVEIEVVPSTPTGAVDVEQMEAALGDDVAVVALTHIPTNGGLINPAAEVGALTKAAGVPYLLDACQSVGQLDLDVGELGCDFLSATGRKYLRGPRGTGFLYVSESILPRLIPDQPDHHGAPWLDPDHYQLREDARRFEQWEFNHGTWQALGTAVDHANAVGMKRIEATVKQRASELRDALTDAGFETFDIGDDKAGLVTTAVPGVTPAAAKAALLQRSINVSISTPDSTWWDAARRDLPEMLRLSLHYITTHEEIEELVSALTAIRDEA